MQGHSLTTAVCSVGRKLALLEMRVVIINLLNKFSFDLIDDPEFQRDPGKELIVKINPLSWYVLI